MFKTAIFKLHNPTRKKQAFLQKAYKNYHLLYDRLLKSIHKDLDSFYNAIAFITKKGETKYSDKKAIQYINNHFKNVLNAFVLSSGLKESLCKDLAGNLMSYKELLSKRPDTSYPSLQSLKREENERMLENLYESFKTCIDTEIANELRNAVTRQRSGETKLKPLSFIRCDTKHQNMAFLYQSDKDKKKYYALLHLLPASRHRKLLITKDHELYDIRSQKQYIKKTSTGLLFSIETGQRVIERYFNHSSSIKEGKLVYDSSKQEYYLHLAFEFKPERVKTETTMGIDRGVNAICAYTISDGHYNVIRDGLYEGKTLNDLLKSEEKRVSELQKRGKEYRFKVRRNWANKIIHDATNMIANIALENKSQIYVEDLQTITDRSKKRKKSAFNRILNRSQFQKFANTLDYKLEERGLPKVKKVHPSYTSMTCVKCCYVSSMNRPKYFDEDGNFVQDKFKCIQCGYEKNADINASHVIAIKGVWTYIRREEKIKQRVETFDAFLHNIICSFTNKSIS